MDKEQKESSAQKQYEDKAEMNQAKMLLSQYWEYKVIHINVNKDVPTQPSTPETASKKLQGSLSPEFIKREFPEVYQKKPTQQNHPATQLQQFLNLLGQERWELVEISQVGELLMFFFKRIISKEIVHSSDA